VINRKIFRKSGPCCSSHVKNFWSTLTAGYPPRCLSIGNWSVAWFACIQLAQHLHFRLHANQSLWIEQTKIGYHGNVPWVIATQFHSMRPAREATKLWRRDGPGWTFYNPTKLSPSHGLTQHMFIIGLQMMHGSECDIEIWWPSVENVAHGRSMSQERPCFICFVVWPTTGLKLHIVSWDGGETRVSRPIVCHLKMHTDLISLLLVVRYL